MPSTLGIVVCAALIGFTTAITLTADAGFAAAARARRADLPRTAAGMFTVSYTCAIVIPTICGALWDVTGKPWTAFVPLCLCAVALTILAASLSALSAGQQKTELTRRYRHQAFRHDIDRTKSTMATAAKKAAPKIGGRSA